MLQKDIIFKLTNYTGILKEGHFNALYTGFARGTSYTLTRLKTLVLCVS